MTAFDGDCFRCRAIFVGRWMCRSPVAFAIVAGCFCGAYIVVPPYPRTGDRGGVHGHADGVDHPADHGVGGAATVRRLYCPTRLHRLASSVEDRLALLWAPASTALVR